MAVLPEQGSAAVLGGPSYDQLLLPVHVLPGQAVAAAAQGPRHVQRLGLGGKTIQNKISLFDWR